MKSLNAIAALCLLSGLLAGCNESPKQEDAQQTPSADARNETAGQTDAAPAAQEPAAGTQVMASIAPGGGATTGGCAPPTSTALPTTVTAGTYCVCNIQSHRIHESMGAEHLKVGQAVVIGEVDWVTSVQLGNTQLDMTRDEDSTELTTVVKYTHEHVQTHEFKDVLHRVRIMPSAERLQGCDGKNVLKVQFCYQTPAGQWSCGSRRGAHNGDTHIQN